MPRADRERCERLRLAPMVADNQSTHQTPFTVSSEAREGIHTGISAHDRARTIEVAIDPRSESSDLVSPGHMFPLRAGPRGVLIARATPRPRWTSPGSPGCIQPA